VSWFHPPPRVFAVALAGMLLGLPESEASPVGRLYGSVKDRAGRPIAGATIRVNGPGAVGIYATSTTSQGTYQFMDLPTHEMLEIRAEAPDKLPLVYFGITVRVDSGTRRDFKLRSEGEHEVLILIDPRVDYHEIGLEGARSTIRADLSVMKVTGRGLTESRRLAELMDLRPNAVLAIGAPAARLARREIKDVPVIYTMVPDPVKDDLSTVNLCGLTLNGGFDDQLQVLATLRPSARRLLTVYDPRSLAPTIRELRRSAENHGMSLQVGPVRDIRQLTRALAELDPRNFDAFFFLLDPDLFDAGDFERVQRFSAGGDMVLIVPDPSLVTAGGTFSNAPGFRELGAHAGRLVNHVLSGKAEPSDIAIGYPPLRSLSINKDVAKRLGIQPVP
jgi:ABC-type uncharacterized transport system substrate-binding protein